MSRFLNKDLVIAALFVMAPNWKQYKYPSADEEINKLVYLYTGILLTNKNKWTIAKNKTIDKSQNTYPEWRKPDKNKYMFYDSIYVISRKWELIRNHWKQISSCWRRRAGRWVEGGIEKVHEEISKGDGYFYHFDCGDGFMGVCTFLICTVSIYFKLFQS